MKYIVALLIAFQLIVFPAVTYAQGCVMMQNRMDAEQSAKAETPCPHDDMVEKADDKESAMELAKFMCDCSTPDVNQLNPDQSSKKQTSVEKIDWHVTLAALQPEVILQAENTRAPPNLSYIPIQSFKAIHAQTSRLLI